jgi:hypothetical protein
MFFFDWCDPPMMIGKALLYLSRESADWFQFAADRCMEIFVVSFVLTRNLVFPWIVYICWRDFPNEWPINALKGMLLIILGLMIFWLCVIVKVIYYQYCANQGNVVDIREHENVDKANPKKTE